MGNSRANAETTTIHSWDFDGMLASGAYLAKIQELIIRAADQNRSLTKEDYKELAQHVFKAYKKEFFDSEFPEGTQTKHVISIGTNRNFRTQDEGDGFLKGRDYYTCTLSCYPFYQALLEVINEEYKANATLNKFLLEDIALGLPPGSIFDDEMHAYLNLKPEVIKEFADLLKLHGSDPKRSNELREAFKKNLEENRYYKEIGELKYDDSSKLLLLYMQMHASLIQYGENTLYHFTDDKGKLLREAQEMFSLNPGLIPQELKEVRIKHFLPSDAEVVKREQELLKKEKEGGLTDQEQAERKTNRLLFVDYEEKPLKKAEGSLNPNIVEFYLKIHDDINRLVYQIPTISNLASNDPAQIAAVSQVANVVKEYTDRAMREGEKQKTTEGSALIRAYTYSPLASVAISEGRSRLSLAQPKDQAGKQLGDLNNIAKLFTQEINVYIKAKKKIAKLSHEFNEEETKAAIKEIFAEKNKEAGKVGAGRKIEISFYEVYKKLAQSRSFKAFLGIQSDERVQLYGDITIAVTMDKDQGVTANLALDRNKIKKLESNLEKIMAHDENKHLESKGIWKTLKSGLNILKKEKEKEDEHETESPKKK